MQDSNRGTRRVEFETAVIRKVEIKTERDQGEVAILRQRRKKDDGTLGGEFVTLRIDMGKRSVFISPELAPQVLNALTDLVQPLLDERKQLQQEFEDRRREYEERKNRESRGGDGGQRPMRCTGKTERTRQKKAVKMQEGRSETQK